MRPFPDLSNNQSMPIDFKAIRSTCDAISYEASFGCWVAPNTPQRRDQIRQASFPVVIWYLFLVADQGIPAQVQTFQNVITHLQPGEAVALDWETYNNKLPTLQQRDEALSLLDKAYGQTTILYCPDSLLYGVAQNWERPRWVASYSRFPQSKFTIWQASDGNYTINRQPPPSFPSVGRVDTNIYNGTVDQLIADLRIRQQPQQQPEDDMPKPTDEVSSAPVPGQFPARWVLTADGGVRALEGAPFFGSHPGLAPGIDANAFPFHTIVAAGATASDGYIIFGQNDVYEKYNSQTKVG